MLDGDLDRDRTTLGRTDVLGDLEASFEPDGSMRADGSYTLTCCRSTYDAKRTWETGSLDYAFDYPGGRLVVENADTEYWYGPHGSIREFSASLSGEFAMEPPVTGNRGIEVRTIEPFAYASEERLDDAALEREAVTWTFSSGSLELVAEDGGRLVLDADTGDASTARVTIENASGTESFDQPWSLWREALTGGPSP